MLAVLRLVRPAWRKLLAAVALSTLATASGVALLAVSAWLITRAAGMPAVLTLMVAIVGVRTFGIGRAVFRYSERLVAHDAALRALIEVRVQLYRALERLAPARYWGTGDLLQRLSADVDALADLFIRGWVPLASSLLVLAGAIAVLAVLLPAAGLLVLIAVLVAIVVAAVGAARSAALESELARLQAQRVGVVTETVQASSDPAVLLGSGWSAELEAVDSDEERVAGALGRWAGAAGAVAVGTLGVAVAGSWMMGRSAGVSGETLAVLVLLPLALTDVTLLFPGALSQWQRGRLAARRIFEVRDAARDEVREPSPPAGPDAARGPSPAAGPVTRAVTGLVSESVTGSIADVATVPTAEGAPGPIPDPASGRIADPVTVPTAGRSGGPVEVRVRDLTVQWPGSTRPAISGVDLDLRPGRRIAVVGESGSGKSTLLAALLGFAPLTAGSIEVDGVPNTVASRRAAMSLCDQQAYLFDSSILENVRLARAAASDDEVLAALRSAQLGDWIDALPKGARTRVGHLGAMVSGGQRQRIAFARALLADRPILLLDEPTASLDQQTGRALTSEMLDVGPDVCVVLVTHELDQLQGFDEVLTLSNGIAVSNLHMS
jgi:ATP-binding cassette subfamily C protein CydC